MNGSLPLLSHVPLCLAKQLNKLTDPKTKFRLSPSSGTRGQAIFATMRTRLRLYTEGGR